MTPRQKDEDWDNRKAFPDCEAWYERCRERSLAFSRSVDFQMDRAYGPNPRNRIDVLPGKPDLPTLFHIHGGYWQWNNREDYLCVGEAAYQVGFNTAFVEHTLAPDATMDEIVAEVRAGLSWFRLHRHEFGIKNSVTGTFIYTIVSNELNKIHMILSVYQKRNTISLFMLIVMYYFVKF